MVIIKLLKKIDRLVVPTVMLLLVICLTTACSSSGFRVSNLAKGDIDFVTDAHYRASQDLLKKLTLKLYRRNPSELSKATNVSVDIRMQTLFTHDGQLILAELNFKQGTDALHLALDPSFRGDRVLALVAGLNGMIRHAYEYRRESFLFDQFDEQKLYQSARNIEILLWQLKTMNDSAVRPLVLTNSRVGEANNLSFERLFGKLIALQDMMAVIVSQQNDRLINTVTQNVASMVFFPL